MKYSRYIFFYINYLIRVNEFEKIDEIVSQLDPLDNNLLILQTKKWIDSKEFYKFNNVFSCKNETDLLSEFLFIIANLYSSQGEFEKSNFYLNVSYYLNKKFIFNLSLLADNFYHNQDYKKSIKILNYFGKKDNIYYWYKLKKTASIITKESNIEEAEDFINSKFLEIKNPSLKILFDMANISKIYENYDAAINYYNKVLDKISYGTSSYAEVLYRRGSCYERLGKYKKSDQDLLMSLKIDPNDAYVLNYLAYSWLERDFRINDAIDMLEKAYKIKKNDPFILDSVGWAYYLTGSFIKAEFFLKKAILLMPNDPVVNDHYSDVLWNLGRKIQATYYWRSVLGFEDTEEKMKNSINIKILKGPQTI